MSSAMENNGKTDEMDERHLLAPWHVTGRLDEADAQALDALSREDPEFAALLEEATREAETTIAVNNALGSPSLSVWTRLEGSIGEHPQGEESPHRKTFLAGALSALSEFFTAISKPQWQAAALAAVLICVAQTGAIVYLAKPQATYTTASGQTPNQAAKRSVFIVSFRDGTTIEAVTATLDEAGAVILDGPTGDGIYHLGLRDDTIKDKDAVGERLRSSPAIKMILPAK